MQKNSMCIPHRIKIELNTFAKDVSRGKCSENFTKLPSVKTALLSELVDGQPLRLRGKQVRDVCFHSDPHSCHIEMSHGSLSFR